MMAFIMQKYKPRIFFRRTGKEKRVIIEEGIKRKQEKERE